MRIESTVGSLDKSCIGYCGAGSSDDGWQSHVMLWSFWSYAGFSTLARWPLYCRYHLHVWVDGQLVA
jgi:hypothetical protein